MSSQPEIVAAAPKAAYTAFSGQGVRNMRHREKVKLIGDIAKSQGVDPVSLVAIGMVESGLDNKAKPGKGSAKGLFQFVDGTWSEQLKKHGKRLGIPPDTSPYDKTANILLAIEYMKGNRAYLKNKSGVPKSFTATDDYMAHFLGMGNARKFYAAKAKNPKAIAKDLLPKSARYNEDVFYAGKRAKTLQEIYGDFQRKLRRFGAKV